MNQTLLYVKCKKKYLALNFILYSHSLSKDNVYSTYKTMHLLILHSPLHEQNDVYSSGSRFKYFTGSKALPIS